MWWLGVLVLWRLDPFEALAEIFDFTAGLVQRVPKKSSITKADLLNSTAEPSALPLRATAIGRIFFKIKS